jgi:hypothetical protein
MYLNKFIITIFFLTGKKLNNMTDSTRITIFISEGDVGDGIR